MLALAGILLLDKQSFRIRRKEILPLLLLDDGNLVGSGTHTNLLKTCDVYREICLSQLSREEGEKTL